MENKKYLIKYYYIGEEQFFGSQRQKSLLTIDDCIINALIEKKYLINVKQSNFEIASRTDKHVSARGSCLSFITNKKPILMEINTALPPSIGMYGLTEVPLNFSARFSALSRHYKYILPIPIINQGEKGSLDLAIMNKACKELEGQHDFSNFSKKGKKEVKTVRDLDFSQTNIVDEFLIFDFKSKSFLRQQVRRMVKKILELGQGKINHDEFLKLFDTKLAISYQPADAHGLILWDIKYDDNVKLEWDVKSIERRNNFFQEKYSFYKHQALIFRFLQQNDP